MQKVVGSSPIIRFHRVASEVDPTHLIRLR
jgi:hypothetical protein